MAGINGLSEAQIKALESLIYGKDVAQCNGKLSYAESIMLSKVLGNKDGLFEDADLKFKKDRDIFEKDGSLNKAILEEMGITLNEDGQAILDTKTKTTLKDGLTELNTFFKNLGFGSSNGSDGSEKDGNISLAEFKKFYGGTDADFKALDINGNGYLAWGEFMAFCEASGIIDKVSDGKASTKVDSKEKLIQILENNIKKEGWAEKLKASKAKVGKQCNTINSFNSIDEISDDKKVDNTTSEEDIIAGLDGKDDKVSFVDYSAYAEFADIDGDGIVTDAEEKAFFSKLKEMKTADPDGYNKLIDDMKKTAAAKKADLAAFKGINDKDKDGKISIAELAAQYGLTKEEASRLDANKDGTIERSEFLAFTKLVREKEASTDPKLLSKDIFKKYLSGDKKISLLDLFKETTAQRRLEMMFKQKIGPNSNKTED